MSAMQDWSKACGYSKLQESQRQHVVYHGVSSPPLPAVSAPSYFFVSFMSRSSGLSMIGMDPVFDESVVLELVVTAEVGVFFEGVVVVDVIEYLDLLGNLAGDSGKDLTL